MPELHPSSSSLSPVSESQMESRWEFTAPQFVDFAAIDLDDDMEEDKFFDVNNETRWCLILSLSGWFVLRCVF